MVSATIMEATRAKVLVQARGLKSFPSAAIMVNTGRKLTTVVLTAVTTAEPTSLVAASITSSLSSPGPASPRCFNMFSVTTIPISTMVPMAMAIPERATIFASTPNTFMAMKHMRTASGSNPEMSMELLRCMTMMRTTMMVTRISPARAELSVPSVS